MEKEFIEYVNCSEKHPFFPYEINDYFENIIEYAKSYILIKRESICDVKIEDRDKILVNLINSPLITVFGQPIKVKTLYKNKKECPQIDSCAMLTELYKDCAYEIFNNPDNLNDEININDRAIVLLDFLNYVSKTNGFAKVFKLKELYDDAEKEKYIAELYELKDFLIYSSNFNKKINNGMTPEELIKNELCRWNINISDISEKSLKKLSKIHKSRFENIMYAILYAYGKSKNKSKIENKFLKEKIIEMSKRN